MHTSWISLVLLLALAVGATYYLCWTESGLRTVAQLLNRRLGPVTLHIEGVAGTLAGGARVAHLTIDHQRVHLQIDEASGRLSLLPLIWQSIQTRDVTVGSLLIQVLPPPKQGGRWEERFLPPWLTIGTEGVDVRHGELLVPSGQRFEATDIHAVGGVHTRDVRIYSGQMNYQGVLVAASGTLWPTNNFRMHADVRMTTPADNPRSLTASAVLDGNMDRLGMTVNLLTPLVVEFHGDLLNLTRNWQWQGRALLRRFDPGIIGAGTALGLVSGTLQLDGNTAGFHAQGPLTPAGLHAGPFDVDFSGEFLGPTLFGRRIEIAHRGSGLTATGSGQILIGAQPVLEVAGRWRDFRWPLTDANAPVHSSDGQLAISGSTTLALQASGALQIGAAAPMQVAARGQFVPGGLQLEHGTVEAVGGPRALSGKLMWNPQFDWQAAATVTGVNLAALRPGINGHLNFQLQADGHGFDRDRRLHVAVSALSGKVRGQPASGSARITLTGDELALEAVQLQLGATQLAADGRIGERVDLRFKVDAADLGLFRDGARGRIQASGVIGGTSQAPLIDGTALGTNILWGPWRVQSLSAAGQFDPHGSGRADLQLHLKELRIGQQELQSADFSTQGTAIAHQIQLAMKTPQGELSATGSGAFANGQWDVQLERLQVEDGRNLQLELDAPAQLSVTTTLDRFSIGQLCLHDGPAHLCGTAQGGRGQRSLSVQADNLPMGGLTNGLIADTHFDGVVSIAVQASAAASGDWQGTMRAALASAAIHHQFRSGRVESFSLGSGRVDADLTAAGLALTAALDAGTSGNVSVAVNLHSAALPWEQWPLTGQLHLQTDALDFFSSYITQLDRASGKLSADLAVAGTAGAPQFTGALKLADAQFDLYQINLSLRDVNLDAQLSDNAVTLNGAAAAGADGHARFKGQIAWRGEQPYGTLHLEGEDLQVVEIPEAKILISPKIDLQIAGRRIDVTGTIDLPYARLVRPEQLTNAVLASSDEIIVSGQPVAPGDQYHVFSTITVRLGDRVTINLLGLSGRLSGNLTASTDDTGLSRGSGELKVEEGKWLAFGRQLDIERGRLIFNNVALSDPALDLRATKVFPDITAGVNVRGTLRNPRMTFFSDPAVPQQQIVSLLLAGGSLDTVQSSNSSSTQRNYALMQGGAVLAQELGSKFNIADVGVESDLNNDTSFVLGRYLSPRIYVSYGVSLAEAINTLKIRYTLGDHWTVKMELGDARSADLVFTIHSKSVPPPASAPAP
jgi:translocation and assembly module TamB